MATAKQKAAARRNIKKAQAANRRHGGHKKSHRSGRSSAGASHAPGIGAVYQGAKVGIAVLAPVANQAITDRSMNGFKSLLTSVPFGEGIAVSLLDQYGSKKIGHAAALSRGSITAWIPEALVVVDAVAAGRGHPISGVAQANADFTGYDFRTNTFDATRVAKYAATKYGLGIARKVVNRTKIARPLKKGLGMVGLTA